ncbi:hypothetical protein Tco_0090172 [Tanacetum coccineum]
MQHNELMDLVTKLSDRVVALETDLKQTKIVYGDAYTKLIMKVKKLEKTVKSSHARRKIRIVVSDDEDDLEDCSKQGRKIDDIDQDHNISLVQHDEEIQERHGQDMEFETNFDVAKEVSTAEDVSTAEPVSTANAAVTTASVVSTASPTKVSTVDDINLAETLVYIRRSASKDKGARKYWKIIRVGNHIEVYQFFDDLLKVFDRDDLVKLWSLVKEREGNGHLHAGREGLSFVKRSSYIDAGSKTLGGRR